MSRRRGGRLRPLYGEELLTTPEPEVVEQEPPVKRVKREKVRPEVPYELLDHVPVSKEAPDYSLLRNALSFSDSRVLAHAIHTSRSNWLAGPMFETYWTRKVRGKKIPVEYAHREKMIKACECEMDMGPHTFRVKLFIVKDDRKDDEEDERSLKSVSDAPLSNPGAQSGVSTALQHDPPAAAPETGPSVVPNATDAKADSVISAPDTKTEAPKTTIENGASSTGKPTQLPSSSQPLVDGPEPTESQPTKPQPTKPDAIKQDATSEVNSETKPPTPASSQESASSPRSNASQPGPSEHSKSAPQPASSEPSSSASQPGPSEPKPQKSVNQLVVFRLQQMAQADKELAELMKLVATGKAPKEAVARFQGYIAKAKEEPKRKGPKPKTPKASTPKAAPKQVTPKAPLTPLPPPAPPKATLLVFEFDENPNERFVLPKYAIQESLPNNEILWSFVHTPIKKPVVGDESDKPEETQTSKEEESTWTPVTVLLRGVPPRTAHALKTCVLRPPKVVEHMKAVMAKGRRADSWHIWTQIDKTDSQALDDLKMSAPPVILPPAGPKRITRRRKEVVPAPSPPPKVEAENKIKVERVPKHPRESTPGPEGPTSMSGSPSTPSSPPDKRQRTDKPKSAKSTPHNPRPLKYPMRASLLLESEPSAANVSDRPRLNLPDLNQFKLPPGAELPPLPPSLRGILGRAPPGDEGESEKTSEKTS